MNKQEKIGKVMKEFKEGTLKTSAGKKVKSRKQAVAIAMSESEGYAEKADLISQINIDSIQEAEDILKAAGTEELFEKAKHQDGDMHPNGKWVWVSSANGGKGDWRTKGGRTHTKHSADGNAGTGSTTTTQQKPTTQVVGTTKKITSDKEFLDTFRDASDDVLNKIVSGKIQASDKEKKLAQQIIDERKKPKVGDVSKLTAQQKSMVDKVMDKGFLMSSNKYKDKSKVELKKTDKGNWRCYYDGRDIGTTISGKLITDSAAKKIGWYKEEVEAKTDSTTTDKPKKRPIAVGTNGPEKRTTQKKESNVDAFKLESKNGFKFKSDSNYRMRYNKREKAYEIWKEGDVYGTKTAMMSIKSDNENIGGDIIKHIQKKYPKTGSTISYSAVTYGF